MKKINIYIITTFLLTWSIFFALMLSGGLENPNARSLVIFCMMVPAISSILTSLLTKNKLKDIWIKPNLKGNIKYYIIGWILPFILVIIGLLTYFLIFPSHFDGSMNTYINTNINRMIEMGQTPPSMEEVKPLLIFQLATTIFVAPIINFISCLGEELGWRGYLLPSLCEKYSYLKATIISSIIWGIWHAPIIAMGHNYGTGYKTAPIGGIFAMIIFCIAIGSMLSYLTLKTKSCIPAIISHGMINGFGVVGSIFLSTSNSNPFLGPLPTGILGGGGFIVISIICLVKINKMDKNCSNNQNSNLI